MRSIHTKIGLPIFTIIFMNAPDKKIHSPIKISNKNFNYFICFISKIYVKISYTSFFLRITQYNVDTHNARARKPYPYEHLRRLGW